MPVLEHVDGGQAVFDTMAEAQEALKSGQWTVPQGQPMQYRTGAGVEFEGTPEEAANVPAYTGAAPAMVGQGLPGEVGAVEKEAWSGFGDQAKAFAEGAGSALTFGGTDVLLAAVGADTAAREDHTAGRTYGEIAGTIAAIAAPLPKGGALAKLAKATPATALSRAAGTAATRGARIGLSITEGAAMGAGNVLSEVALSDPGLSAETLAANAGNFAHGMLLGGALGLGGGLLGEGVTAYAARKAARSPKMNFASGPGKEAVTELVEAHKSIDDLADYTTEVAQKSVDDFESTIKQQAGDLHAGRSSVLRESVDEVDDTLRRANARYSDETAEEIASLRADLDKVNAGEAALPVSHADAAFSKYNDLAPMVGLARLPRSMLAKIEKEVLEKGIEHPNLNKFVSALDDLLDAQHATDKVTSSLYAKAAKTGKDEDMLAYLNRAKAVATESKADDVAEMVSKRLNQYEEGGKHVDDFVKTSREQLAPKLSITQREAAREALALLPKQKLTPAGMQRFLEQPDLPNRIKALGAYYDEVGKAAGAHPTAKLQFDDAMKRIQGAMDNILTPEAKNALTPQATAALLGLESANELLDLPPPIQNIIRVAALYKGLGALSGMAAKSSSTWRRIARSMARRGAAAAGANAVYRGPAGDLLESALGPLGRAAGAGVGATGAVEVVERFAGSRLKGVKAVADDTNALKQEISEKVINGLGKGKPPPGKIRMLPGVNKAMDKLIGDPKETKGKNEQQKFKIVQQRLAQFSASPQSVMDGIYQAIKPMQEASEQVADMLETSFGAHLEYAYETMPKDPGTMVSFGKSMWQPTDRQLYEWGTHLVGALFPMETLDALVQGSVPPQSVQCLAKTNPAIFNEFVRNVMENGDAIRDNATYDQKIALGLALQIPLEPTTDPQYVAFIQNSHAEQTMAAAAGPTQDKSSPEEDYSDAQKLLS